MESTRKFTFSLSGCKSIVQAGINSTADFYSQVKTYSFESVAISISCKECGNKNGRS
jgi:hypothetical protein